MINIKGAAGRAKRAINRIVIAITNCYRTVGGGKAFYLATQTATPQVTEKPSQQLVQNALRPTYVAKIVSC